MVAAGGDGHTLEITAGTYNEGNSTIDVPSGSDLTAGANTIKNHGTDIVTLGPDNPFNTYNGAFHHVIFDGLIWSGGDGLAFAGASPAHHIRFKNFEVVNFAVQGFLLGGTGGNEFIDGNIHDGGTDDQTHGIYMASANNLVERVNFSNITGYCIQIYISPPAALDNNIIRFSTFSNCNTTIHKSEVTVYYGDNIQIYGNIFKNGLEQGLSVGTASTTNLKIYNNTFYNYSGACIYSDNNSPGSVAVINNICSQTAGIANAGSGSFTTATNLCSSAGFGCSLSEPVSTTFTNAGSGDFTLKTGSAAIDGGTPLSSPYNIDRVATTRPQGVAFDVGAFEKATAACSAMPQALVASYAFEGVATDGTGNGHTATLGTGWSYTTGKFGQGVTSTGVSGITIADANDLDFCNGFTYETWVNLPDTLGDYAVIVKNPDSKSFLFGSISGFCGAGRPMGGYSQNESGLTACYSTASLTTGVLNHLAVTYDATAGSNNLNLYINGLLAVSANGTSLLDATTGTLQICTSGFSETCPSGTIVDEVRVYNYARSGAQVLADSTTPLAVPAAPTGFKLK